MTLAYAFQMTRAARGQKCAFTRFRFELPRALWEAENLPHARGGFFAARETSQEYHAPFLTLLGYYKGQPAAVGGQKYPDANKGFTEKLTENGWEKLPPHPM